MSEVNDSLKQELEECKKEREDQSRFLSMVIHALRTPLAGSMWTFKMLLDGDMGSFTDEQKKIIKTAYERTEQMADLMDEAILANQENIWDFQYKMEKIDIEKLLEKVISEFFEEARIKNVRIILDHPAVTPLYINADLSKLALAFQNLIGNAIKYNKEGGEIIIELNQENNKLNIEIRDTGIGIPDESKDKIFTEFFRAQNAKEATPKGTGLGLFTAKNIIERHGGSITYTSILGQGTTFLIELPFLAE